MLDEAVRGGAPHGRETLRLDRFAERARGHLADPLFRNAYALMVNAGATGALGVLYWILAARYYAAADVGRGAAAISAMMLLSGFTALALTGTLSRFLPRAGPATRSLILTAYVVSGIAAATVTAGFLLTLERWGPSFARLHGLGPGLGFTIGVITWGIFTLQDAVLPALRSAVWVPVENAGFGAVKIALALVLAVALPRDGIFLSWVIPVALSVVPINLLILRRLAPRHVRATADRHVPPTIRDVGRFMVGDYVGALFALGVVYFVPVVVAAQVAPRTNAYFSVAWIIGSVIGLLAVNMAISLTVEGTLDRDRLGANTAAALRRMSRILVPIVVAAIVLARPGLAIFGASYARNAAPLLRLLALSALPGALVELHVGTLRAESRTTRLAAIQGLRCALVVGLTLLFTGAYGIVGAGWAALVSQSVTAAVAVPGLMATVGRHPHVWPRLRHLVVPRPIAALAATTGVGLLLFLLPLRTVQMGAMNGYGLVSVLPVASFAGLGVLTVGYILTLALDRPRRAFLALQLGLLVVCLHGVTAFVESEPRFATAYQHLGFLDYIDRTGQPAPTLDGRFNWPGFFAVMSFFGRAVGISEPTALLKPAPVVAELLYLVPYLLLLACIRATWRTRWFAAFLLVVSNWVGQDYFSPQSFNFLVYLLTMAFLLGWFGVAHHPFANGLFERALGRVPVPRPLTALVRGRDPTSTAPGELPPRAATNGQRLAVAALIIGLFVVSTASHQITPFMILAAVAALVVAGRCELTGLPLLFGVIMVSWLIFMATGYWTGHLSNIFGNVGSLGANVEASVQGRALQSNPQHATVLHTRFALGGLVFGLAALGALRRRRSGVRDRALLVLAVAPFSALGLQSYGGEVGLRAYLFALPALCALGASLFFGVATERRSWAALGAGCALALVLVGGFLVARYGNERFERTGRGELAALDAVYRRDHPAAQVAWLTPVPELDATPSMPWGARDMERVKYFAVDAPRDPRRTSLIVDELRDLGPGSYLVVNRAQLAYLELSYSFPPGWGEQVRAQLEATPGIRRVVANDDAVVYTLAPRVTGPGRTAPLPGFSVGMTPLTPVGIVVLALLIAVLVAREIRRVGLPVEARHRLAPLTRVAYVLLAVWVGVVVERFVRLS